MTDGATILYDNVILPSWNYRKQDYIAFADGFEKILSIIGGYMVASEKEVKNKVKEEMGASKLATETKSDS